MTKKSLILFKSSTVFRPFTFGLTCVATMALTSQMTWAANTVDQRQPNQVETDKIKEVLQISTDPAIKALVLVADKTARKVYVIENDGDFKSIESHEIDIGKKSGNKTKRDDKKTPEGIYTLEKKLLPPEIPFDLYGSMALTTNYPNVFDKFDNKSGSGIWFHSVPDNVPLNRGSRGCVVVRNNIIKNISQRVTLGKSFLIINDKTHWITKEEHDALRDSVLTWLESWRALWEKQDLEAYIKMYSEDFSAPGGRKDTAFTKESWLKHKERLKSLYKSVEIKLGMPHIFHEKNQFLVKFTQDYISDAHKDRGIKTLYVINENNTYKIIREEWAPVSAADSSSPPSSPSGTTPNTATTATSAPTTTEDSVSK